MSSKKSKKSDLKNPIENFLLARSDRTYTWSHLWIVRYGNTAPKVVEGGEGIKLLDLSTPDAKKSDEESDDKMCEKVKSEVDQIR